MFSNISCSFLKLGLGCHEAAKWFVLLFFLIMEPHEIYFTLIYENETKTVSKVAATAPAEAVAKDVAMDILCFNVNSCDDEDAATNLDTSCGSLSN